MTARGRLIALMAALIAAAIAIVIIAGRGDRKPSSPAARGDAMSGMAGMPGMEPASSASGGSMQLTANELRDFGVTFGTAEVRSLESEVRATGIVAIDETRMTQVAAKFAGFAEQLHVDFTGQMVARGQPLLDVYSPELVAAQEELLVARRLERTVGEAPIPGVPAGNTNFEAAARRRLLLWDISPAQIDEVLRSGRSRRTMTLHAATSGTVVEKRVVRGQSFEAGEPLYVLADLSGVWIEVELRLEDGPVVRPGAGATVEVPGVARPVKGRVEYIYPTVAQESRTVKARIAVSNSTGRLKPGMYATVRLASPGTSALTVPRSAVVRTGERALVFVDMGPAATGRAIMPHEVEVGRSAGEYVEILSGVMAGNRVVTSAQFLLESESNIADVMRSMIGQGATDAPAMRDMPGMKMDVRDRGADVRSMPGMKMPAQPSRPPR